VYHTSSSHNGQLRDRGTGLGLPHRLGLQEGLGGSLDGSTGRVSQDHHLRCHEAGLWPCHSHWSDSGWKWKDVYNNLYSWNMLKLETESKLSWNNELGTGWLARTSQCLKASVCIYINPMINMLEFTRTQSILKALRSGGDRSHTKQMKKPVFNQPFF
jgi:hypothetical protein